MGILGYDTSWASTFANSKAKRPCNLLEMTGCDLRKSGISQMDLSVHCQRYLTVELDVARRFILNFVEFCKELQKAGPSCKGPGMIYVLERYNWLSFSRL